MPAHGVDIIDGIPVLLKGGVMYAFQPSIQTQEIRLGTYDNETKKAIWEPTLLQTTWLETFRTGMAPRSRATAK